MGDPVEADVAAALERAGVAYERDCEKHPTTSCFATSQEVEKQEVSVMAEIVPMTAAVGVLVAHGTAEWHAQRLGNFTASRAPALMARTRDGGPSADCLALIAELALERLTDEVASHFVTPAMEHGTALEAAGVEVYMIERTELPRPAGLMVHPDRPNVAATPDRLVGDDGLLEIKCPSRADKHLASLLHGRGGAGGDALRKRLADKAAAVEYAHQAQWQLWVTGRAWCDVASYDPRWPPHLQLAVTRIHALPEAHEAYAEAVEWAEDLIEAAMAALPGAGPSGALTFA